jgi:hypothetical protein
MALCFVAAHSVAQTPPMMVPVAGKTVTLTLPEKTCTYDRKDKADSKALDAMEKANASSMLLLAFIDCDNLKFGRGTKGSSYAPGFYGEILSNISGHKIADVYTREKYVQAISAQYGTDSPETVMAKGEQLLRNMPANMIDTGQSQNIGIIKRDKDFIQMAVIGSSQVPLPPPRLGIAPPPITMQKIINVITLTKLGVPVSITLAHPATPDMTLQGLSDRSELYVRQLLSLNPDSMPILSKSLDWWSIMVGMLGGIVISMITGMLFKKRS